MKLTNVKEGARAAKAPAGSPTDDERSERSAEDLITALTIADEKQRKALLRSRIFFLIATCIFCAGFLVLLLDPESATGTAKDTMLQMGGLACIYMYVMILFLARIRRLSRIDYSAPVLQFLTKAELRYRFMKPSDWVIIITGLPVVIGLMSIGTTPYLSRVFGFSDAYWPMTIIFAGFVLAVAGMGLYFTRKDWERERAPLWRQITTALHEFEGE